MEEKLILEIIERLENEIRKLEIKKSKYILFWNNNEEIHLKKLNNILLKSYELLEKIIEN